MYKSSQSKAWVQMAHAQLMASTAFISGLATIVYTIQKIV